MIFLLDTHVHFYQNYSLEQWLDSLFNNFESHKKILRFKDAESIGYGIILTERSNEDFFSTWKKSNTLAHCFINEISETCFTILHPSHQTPLYVYQGQQIKTLEGLEVLCLSRRTTLPNGLSLLDTTKELIDQNELVVIPWSFGKWLGARRKVIYEVLSMNAQTLFIGDIFGRPSIDSLQLLSVNYQKNIVYGTDPLPLSEETKMGATTISIFSILSETIPDQIVPSLFSSLSGSNTLKRASLFGSLIRQINYRIKQ